MTVAGLPPLDCAMLTDHMHMQVKLGRSRGAAADHMLRHLAWRRQPPPATGSTCLAPAPACPHDAPLPAMPPPQGDWLVPAEPPSAPNSTRGPTPVPLLEGKVALTPRPPPRHSAAEDTNVFLSEVGGATEEAAVEPRACGRRRAATAGGAMP